MSGFYGSANATRTWVLNYFSLIYSIQLPAHHIIASKFSAMKERKLCKTFNVTIVPWTRFAWCLSVLFDLLLLAGRFRVPPLCVNSNTKRPEINLRTNHALARRMMRSTWCLRAPWASNEQSAGPYYNGDGRWWWWRGLWQVGQTDGDSRTNGRMAVTAGRLRMLLCPRVNNDAIQSARVLCFTGQDTS